MSIPTNTFELTFWTCAILGTALFAIKAISALFLGAEYDLDTDLVAGDVAHEGVGSSDAAFELFSITSITGFFMMFGWSGLAAYKEFQWSGIVSLLFAGGIGFLTMIGTAKLFSVARLLVSRGSVFTINTALHKTGSVYQAIPAGGRGVIQITIGGQLREIVAESESGEEIPSFVNVEVVSIVSDDTVKVRRM